MKVVATGFETSHRDITTDSRTIELVGIVEKDKRLLGLLFQIIRRFHTAAELENGRDGKASNLEQLVRDYPVTPALLGARSKVRDLVHDLYHDFKPSEARVRGALLEAVVEGRLRTRYSGNGSMLENNLQFQIENGSTYSSGTKSIDVLGFDGQLGECHDCKANAARFEPDWVHELQTEVATRGFRIGLVTATGSRSWAETLMRKAGITVAPETAILTSKDFYPLTPLQSAVP